MQVLNILYTKRHSSKSFSFKMYFHIHKILNNPHPIATMNETKWTHRNMGFYFGTNHKVWLSWYNFSRPNYKEIRKEPPAHTGSWWRKRPQKQADNKYVIDLNKIGLNKIGLNELGLNELGLNELVLNEVLHLYNWKNLPERWWKEPLPSQHSYSMRNNK